MTNLEWHMAEVDSEAYMALVDGFDDYMHVRFFMAVDLRCWLQQELAIYRSLVDTIGQKPMG
jgi:hypothetical protein